EVFEDGPGGGERRGPNRTRRRRRWRRGLGANGRGGERRCESEADEQADGPAEAGRAIGQDVKYWRRFDRSRACLNLRDSEAKSVRVSDAVRRASGFFCRSIGMTIDSKNVASRSAKCRYIIRWRGSIPYLK